MFKKILSPYQQNLIIEKIIKFLGITVVLSIVGIAVNLLLVALPLFFDPSSEIIFQFNSHKSGLGEANNKFLKLGFLDAKGYIYLVNEQGEVHFFNAETAKKVAVIPIREKLLEKALQVDITSNGNIVIFYQDGVGKEVHPELIDINGEISAKLTLINDFKFNSKNFKFGHARYRDGRFHQLSVNGSQQVNYEISEEITDFTGNSVKSTTTNSFNLKLIAPKLFLLNEDATKLYITNNTGFLESWYLGEDGPEMIASEKIATQAISSIVFVLGEVSLFLSLQDGTNILLDPAPANNNENLSFRFRHSTSFAKGKNFNQLRHSYLNRVVFGVNMDNEIKFIYTTSAKEILSIENQLPILDLRVDDYQESLATLAKNGLVTLYKLDMPYPEISFSTLFEELTYESYPESSYTWQSSSGQDDFEPKLSLVPLIIGSLKGTLYAMILVVPLSLLGAIYLSQFAKPKIRNTLKPMIEIVSSVPSVVIGFLAALWLGPRLEENFLHFILFFPLLAIIYFLSYKLFAPNRGLFKNFSFSGWEFVLAIIPFFLTLVAVNYLGDYMSHHLFNNNFVIWLYENYDIRYEQQNAIVTAIALGFAAMPLIFTIADDALRSVPETFKSGSLALGASQWQTVWRVVLPTAAPGVFAAFILGASRAIGETMIVLMASGNTPITDFSLFNGMRTLSANIAVEIPEAPIGGTLYRTLFLSGLILFLITFIFNSLAEIIRHRLQKQYGRL
ncbi:MAG: ABC transporter permease subunit [SAR324 cluster bacterium]|nr:ABC transporter permease subunit [SAR324 cluster bacterium]